MSEAWQCERSLRARETEAFLPEWQTHTLANPSDRCGDTEVRQLRSGSRHF